MYRTFLKEKYIRYSILEYFDNDYKYLKQSIQEINNLWFMNINKVI